MKRYPYVCVCVWGGGGGGGGDVGLVSTCLVERGLHIHALTQ